VRVAREPIALPDDGRQPATEDPADATTSASARVSAARRRRRNPVAGTPAARRATAFAYAMVAAVRIGVVNRVGQRVPFNKKQMIVVV